MFGTVSTLQEEINVGSRPPRGSRPSPATMRSKSRSAGQQSSSRRCLPTIFGSYAQLQASDFGCSQQAFLEARDEAYAVDSKQPFDYLKGLENEPHHIQIEYLNWQASENVRNYLKW